MADGNGKKKEFSLGNNFDVTVKVNGIRIEVATDGSIDAYTDGNVEVHPVSSDDKKPAVPTTPQIGDVLPDGWIFLGNSPQTGKAYSLEPVEGAMEGVTTWYEGEDHAAALNARQPSEESDDTSELLDIFNKIVKGHHNDVARLDTSGSNPYGRCWSSTPDPDGARVRYFDDGGRNWDSKDTQARVRCVRDEPQL